MVLQEYTPSPALSEYVRTFRLVRYDHRSDGPLPAKPYPPRPEYCLSFYVRDCEVVSLHKQAVVADARADVDRYLVGSLLCLIRRWYCSHL